MSKYIQQPNGVVFKYPKRAASNQFELRTLEGEPISSVFVHSSVKPLSNGQVWWCDGVHTKEAYRGKGYMQQLLKLVLKYDDRAPLMVEARNSQINIYMRAGFRRLTAEEQTRYLPDIRAHQRKFGIAPTRGDSEYTPLIKGHR